MRKNPHEVEILEGKNFVKPHTLVAIGGLASTLFETITSFIYAIFITNTMSKKLLITGIVVLLVVLGGISIFIINPPQKNGSNENTVSWNEAIRILNGGEVEQVVQLHSHGVTLILKDGRSINTKEPAIDDIFDEVKKCGNPCKNIDVITE